MTASNGRARRWDAGLVRPTDRDVRVLRWLGEMYAAPMDVVQQLYGVGDSVARRHAARLHRAGLVGREYGPRGGLWLVPTLRGLRYAGLAYGAWSLTGWKAEHLAAVGRLRLVLHAAYPGAVWTSERAIRAEWHGSGARVRICDGILDLSDRRVGVELELHRKSAHRYPGICADVDPSLDQVWWFVPGDPARHLVEVTWLRGVLDGIPKPERPEHLVYPLTGELAGVLG